MYLTTHDTGKVFNDWCAEQNLSASNILAEMYINLTKKNQKINTFLLHGESNAGKTYWSKALSPIEVITGQTIQRSDFAWSKCIEKEIIMIPELSFTKPVQVEKRSRYSKDCLQQ